MQPKFLLVGGVLVVAISGFFLWQLFGGAGGGSQVTQDSVVTPELMEVVDEEPLRGSGSFEALLARGENLECTVRNQVSATMEVEGTSFFSQGRIRGDFLTNDTGQTTLSSMIIAGDTLYTWSEVEGEVYGVKMSLSDVPSSNDGEAVSAREPVSLDEAVDYECTVWSPVDGSIFVPPSNVLFRDMSEVMNMGMEFGTVYEAPASGAGQCSLCEGMPTGEARQLCLQNFGCE